ncbi:MAG TPA: GvpL/GvpF family gas vesicle protein, partial [Rhodothermales bacterium]
NRVSYADAAVAQRREPEEQRERDYYYTYGVVREQIPSNVLKGTGIQPERPPFLIPCGTVFAVVSKLEGLPFHSSERDAELREPARKREYKREHIRVLEAISSAGYTVVPRPYGTIAASEDKIMRAVTAQSASFEAALERLNGRREWSVQLFKTQNPHVEEVRPLAGLYASGDSYARLYDAGLEAAPSGEEEVEESGLVAVIKRSIYNALLAVAADATMNATYGARTEKGLMVLNAAYLVDVEHEDSFLETAARLNERQKSLGFALVCSGPRVPLSFWQ